MVYIDRLSTFDYLAPFLVWLFIYFIFLGPWWCNTLALKFAAPSTPYVFGISAGLHHHHHHLMQVISRATPGN